MSSTGRAATFVHLYAMWWTQTCTLVYRDYQRDIMRDKCEDYQHMTQCCHEAEKHRLMYIHATQYIPQLGTCGPSDVFRLTANAYPITSPPGPPAAPVTSPPGPSYVTCTVFQFLTWARNSNVMQSAVIHSTLQYSSYVSYDQRYRLCIYCRSELYTVDQRYIL